MIKKKEKIIINNQDGKEDPYEKGLPNIKNPRVLTYRYQKVILVISPKIIQIMLVCKRWQSASIYRNGIARNVQRYRCKSCKYNFIQGDKGMKDSLKAKKALAVILYGLGKGSYNMLGKIFKVNRSLVYGWIKEAAHKLPYPTISDHIKEIEFDEMWHLVGEKKQEMDHQSLGSSYQKKSWMGYWQAR
jgi:transposase